MGVLGIDCGKTGALCFHDGSFFRFYDLPYRDGEVDILELNRLTFQLPLDCIIIEEQSTFASDGRLGAFTMGLNYGRILAWAESRCSNLCRVRPQVWQKSLGIALKHEKGTTNTERKKATKAAAFATLQAMHPQTAEFCVGPRGGIKDGIVDAILISIWGYNELRNSYWPTRSGIGCFSDVVLAATPKGSKGRQGSKRSGGKRR
jgi:hypothetical protein